MIVFLGCLVGWLIFSTTRDEVESTSVTMEQVSESIIVQDTIMVDGQAIDIIE